MTLRQISQRLQNIEADYKFYSIVGDFAMAEQSRLDWVYYNTLVEGERYVA